jgi:hypothetical protein
VSKRKLGSAVAEDPGFAQIAIGKFRGGKGVKLRIVMALGGALLMAGCVTTSMQGYADTAPPERPIAHLAALVSAPMGLQADFQRSLSAEAKKRGLSLTDAFIIFPPTRAYTNAEITAQLAARGIDGVLLISVGDSGINREYAGTIFSGQSFGNYSGAGTVNTFGGMSNVTVSGTYSGTTYGSATPTYRYSRTTRFTAKLMDAATGRTLWVGGGQVNAGGLLFVGNGTSASNSASAIFDDLTRKGVVAHVGS